MNTRTLIGLTAMAAFGAQVASADDWRRDHDRGYGRDVRHARVVHVEPIVDRYRVSVPVQQCRVESRYREAHVPVRTSATGAAILGGVAGAVLGSQFGSGDGRKAATVAGAAIGAAIGHDAARRSDGYAYRVEPQVREVERCRTVHDTRYEERVVAYRVTYAWNGRHHVTEMPHDPGRRIRVGVDVYPLR